MLNKKSVFNFIYAIALVGAIISCVGILNEFLNIAQLYDMEIYNTTTLTRGSFFKPFIFYLLAFIISGISVTALILNLLGISKLNKKTVNIVLALSCAILIIMSFIFVFVLRSYNDYYERFGMSNFRYLIYYTFRSGVMSFAANTGIILACNLIDEKCRKAQDAE